MKLSVVDRVARTISRYNMFASGHRVGIAVSGGADSVCLLHILREIAPRWDLSLTVLHLNHQLRGTESEEDAAFVAGLAAALGLSVIVERADVQGTGGNLEEAGRDARREFYRKHGFDRVATGHTLNDQAETVLYRLIRGSGTAGLSGVRPVSGDGLVRPLIECGRTEIEAWLCERGIVWRDDRTNSDVKFARNRIRHELLPYLVREFNSSLPGTLAQMAVTAQDEEEYWQAEIAAVAARYFVRRPPAVLVRTTDLLSLPKAVSRRLLRRAVEETKGDLRSVDSSHIEALLRLAGGREGHGRLQVPGLDVFRSFEWLRIAPPRIGTREDHDYVVPLTIPGSAAIPEAESTVYLEVEAVETGYTKDGSSLDGDLLADPVELRNWHPGDQIMRRAGSSEKIKALFQEKRVPIWERQGWPVITSRGKIVWTRRFGVDAEFAATAESRTVVRVLETANFADD
jgi:tRNA(Ile)-lysidine synthase